MEPIDALFVGDETGSYVIEIWVGEPAVLLGDFDALIILASVAVALFLGVYLAVRPRKRSSTTK